MGLNSVMEFGHVIVVNPDGTYDDAKGKYAPEVYVTADADGQISKADDDEMVKSIAGVGWTVVNGWSGQYGYSGPIMHDSEYVGGSLEEWIMSNPGYYVTCTVDILPQGDDEDAETDVAGWVLLFRPLEAPRYIAYVGTGIPGDIPAVMGVSTVKEAASYLRDYAVRSYSNAVWMSLYTCLGDEDMWGEALEFRSDGIPFDYAAYNLTVGARGGVKVERG